MDDKTLINFMMGNFITGEGPENIVFPENSEISKRMLNSDIVAYALLDWYNSNKKALNNKDPKSLVGIKPTLISFGSREAIADVVDNGFSIFGIPGFVGSATITIIPNEKDIKIKVFNITSVTSGDLWKDLPWNDESISSVRFRDQTTPWGNTSQEYSVSIPIDWEQPFNTISKYVIRY
jgi:hypothetical protein